MAIDGSTAARGNRGFIPRVQDLECRLLLTTTSSNLAYLMGRAQHANDVFVGDLKGLELRSHATTAEYQALRNDALAISQDASKTTLGRQSAQSKALAASLQLDECPLNGWVGNKGWATIESRLTSDLDGLNVPPALIDQTITDMRSIAESAGVSAVEEQHLQNDMDALQDARLRLPSYDSHFPDPRIYYTQHLRRFFRGDISQRKQESADLDKALQTTESGAGDSAAQANILKRDAISLEKIGAALTTEQDQQLSDAYVAAFSHGAPTVSDLAQLRQEFNSVLNTRADAATRNEAGRLLSDATSFYSASGASVAAIRTVVGDVAALVAAGGAAPPNPFKIQIS